MDRLGHVYQRIHTGIPRDVQCDHEYKCQCAGVCLLRPDLGQESDTGGQRVLSIYGWQRFPRKV